MKLHEEKEYFDILVVGIGPTTLHDKGNETICEQCCYRYGCYYQIHRNRDSRLTRKTRNKGTVLTQC